MLHRTVRARRRRRVRPTSAVRRRQTWQLFFGRIFGDKKRMERIEVALRLGDKRVCEAAALRTSAGLYSGHEPMSPRSNGIR